MLLNYRIPFLLIVFKLINAEHYHDDIISISSVLGTRLIFNVEIFDEDLQIVFWYKGSTDLKPLINSTGLSVNFTIPTRSRYYIVNQTRLIIEQTLIGDEGFYTLKIRTKPNIYKQYLYHVGFTSLIYIYFSGKSLF
jgi:hypothetical protein